MRTGADISITFPELFLVHHNKPSLSIRGHSHSERHVIFPLKGEVRVMCSGNSLSAGPGRMIFVPSHVEHEFLATNSKEGERLICLIGEKLWKSSSTQAFEFGVYPAHQLTKELLFYLLLHPKSKNIKILSKLFVSTLSENMAASRQLGANESIQHLLSKAKDARVQKSVKYLESHFSKNFKMEDVARISGLSVRNLSRLFLQELGIGPKEALIRIRLEEAKRLLQVENQSVTEACFRVGYQSLSRFIEAFRDTFGQLPSEV